VSITRCKRTDAAGLSRPPSFGRPAPGAAAGHRTFETRYLAVGVARCLWGTVLALAVVVAGFTAVPASAVAQTGSLTGHVYDQIDQPIANAVVSTSDAGGNPYSVTTDASGAFMLANLPAPANYNLHVAPPPGYTGTTVTTETYAGQTNAVGYLIVHTEQGVIEGVVTDQTGAPLYGIQVHVSTYQSSTTNSKGQYSIGDLYPGNYTVSVVDGNTTRAEGTVTVDGGTHTLNVSLPPPQVRAATVAHNSLRDLAYLNSERASDGLPAGILLNPRWSVECAAHDMYLRANGLLQHTENPAQRDASPGGAWAGESAILSEGTPWTKRRNPWENAPIHLDQLFSPSLSVVGIDDNNGYVSTTTWPGMLRSPPTTDTIYTYPGNKAKGIPASELAAESPFVPQQFVGIRPGRATGRELFVYLNRAHDVGQSPVTIVAAMLKGSNGGLQLRWVSTTTKSIGPYLAGAIIIPVKPLTADTKYTATVKVKDGKETLSHSWSFTTAGRAPKRRR
jgi:hypothetical protein